MSKLTAPRGFEDPEKRREAAAYIKVMIDAYFGDSQLKKKVTRYQRSQDTYDDVIVPSAIEDDPDLPPYNTSLLKIRIDGLVEDIVGGFDAASPYFAFSGGDDIAAREAREHDTQLALEADDYTFKVGERARLAAIWGLGPTRITWEVRRKGEGWQSSEIIKDQEIEFAGPKFDTILAEHAVWYPLTATDINAVRCVGHKVIDRPMWQIWAMQDRGEYFDKEDIDVKAQHDQKEAAENEEEWCPDIYEVYVRLPEGMDKSKPLQPYHCVFAYGQDAMLFMELYDLPTPPYFFPGLRYDPKTKWPANSVASSLLEPQTASNDSKTAQMAEALARSRPTVGASGMVGEQTTYPLTRGNIIAFPGDPKFFPIPIHGDSAQGLQMIYQDAHREADGVSGRDQVSGGQLPVEEQKATTIAVAAAGTSKALAAYLRNFTQEEERAIQFLQILIRRNFKSFKRFHGYKLKTQKASDWDACYTVKANNRNSSNDPKTKAANLGTFLDSAQQLGVALAPSENIVIDGGEAVKAIAAHLDIPTEKLLVELEPQPLPQVEEPSLGFGGPGDIPPELLAEVAAGTDPSLLFGMDGGAGGGFNGGFGDPALAGAGV